MEANFIIGIMVLIFSVVIHELSHGYVAVMWGDLTPRLQGRLTLNPFKHLDIFGSFIVPAITILLGAGIFGWAKPVEVNSYNFKDRRWGEFWTAIAGPFSNVVMALLFVLIIRLGGEAVSLPFVSFSLLVIYTNITLAIFNLMPIPPLDGSKVLFTLFPKVFEKIRAKFENYFLIFVIIFVFLLWDILAPVIPKFVKILIGF